MTTNENGFYCDGCENEIEDCDSCGKEFTAGDTIYCFNGGSEHYCGDCVKEAQAESSES